MGPAAAAGEGAVAGEEQDPAVVVLDHRRDDGLGQVEGAVENNAPDMFPILHRHLGEGFVRPDRGVVNEDVDMAELGQGPRRQFVGLLLMRDIGDDGDRLDPEIPDLARDSLGLGLVGARVDDDVGALPGQHQCRGPADVASGPGDQRDFSLELTHRHTS